MKKIDNKISAKNVSKSDLIEALNSVKTDVISISLIEYSNGDKEISISGQEYGTDIKITSIKDLFDLM